MPSKVRAFVHEGKWHDIEVEDDVTAYIEYPNGATGVFVTSTGTYPSTNRFEVQGDLGKILLDENKLTLFKSNMSEREFNSTTKSMWDTPGLEKIDIECGSEYPGHFAILKNFNEAILLGTPLMIHGSEGIKGLTISNAMHLSGWLDKTIELPLDEDLFLSELKKKIATSKIKTGKDKFAENMNDSF